jgi:hypothetical protein
MPSAPAIAEPEAEPGLAGNSQEARRELWCCDHTVVWPFRHAAYCSARLPVKGATPMP